MSVTHIIVFHDHPDHAAGASAILKEKIICSHFIHKENFQHNVKLRKDYLEKVIESDKTISILYELLINYCQCINLQKIRCWAINC